MDKTTKLIFLYGVCGGIGGMIVALALTQMFSQLTSDQLVLNSFAALIGLVCGSGGVLIAEIILGVRIK